MANEPSHITQLRKLKRLKTHGKVVGPDGKESNLDFLSIVSILTAYDALKKSVNKKKFGKLPLEKVKLLSLKMITR